MGYNLEISFPIRMLIEKWEACLIEDRLMVGRHVNNINYYWLTKNMMGLLMEEIANNCKAARESTQALMMSLTNMGTTLQALNATFGW